MAPKSWYLLISSKGWIKATDTYCTHAIECRRYLALTLLLVYLLHGHSLISARFAKIELIFLSNHFSSSRWDLDHLSFVIRSFQQCLPYWYSYRNDLLWMVLSPDQLDSPLWTSSESVSVCILPRIFLNLLGRSDGNIRQPLKCNIMKQW